MSAIIPTRHKAKLPKLYSWPIGAQELSEHLRGVPQYDALSLSFWFRPSHPGDTLIPLVWTEYRYIRSGLSGPSFLIDSGWYDETWGITAYAILRRQRYQVHELLCEAGLPRVASWLSAPRAETWRSGRHSFEVLFSPAEGSLKFREEGR